MGAYYNENDAYAGQWLANLANNGLIASGRVDTRSITDVEASDLVGDSQVHFFAGIGGWSYALRLAGVPDDAPVWTGSCPCQPFSSAGKRRGTDDARHLWPVFRDLIAEGRPALVFGEQVASRNGRDWLAAVLADLEDLGYHADAADLCAAGVGAPHIRQRLFWGAARVGDALCPRPQRHRRSLDLHGPTGWPTSGRHGPPPGGDGGGVGDADRQREGAVGSVSGWPQPHRQGGAWTATDWLPCRDRTLRPVEPGTFPLAYGVPQRVGRLRGYGNAIVPQVAAVFVTCFLDDVAEMFSGAP